MPYLTTDILFKVTDYEHKPRFSRNICYKTCVHLKKANSIILDLGYVGEAAEFKLNGQTVDTHPTLQYLFDLTDFAKEDNNSLSIIISNQLGYNHRDPFYSYLVFEPSVLMEPVKILTYQKESEAEK